MPPKRLISPNAKRLADWNLTKQDMQFCQRLLLRYQSVLALPEPVMPEGDGQQLLDLSEAVLTAIIVKFTLCFQNSKSRGALSPATVYGQDSELFRKYAFVDSFRNKHVVHDENADYIAACMLERADDGTPLKITCIVARAHLGYLGPFHEMLVTLVDQALTWLDDRIANLRQKVWAEVQAMSPEEIEALPAPIVGNVFDMANVNSRRGREPKVSPAPAETDQSAGNSAPVPGRNPTSP